MPASIGKVFLSKAVALPFFTFRRLRNGHVYWPMHWEEVNKDGLRGSWMIYDHVIEPDVVIYYCHGGGFAMGSSFFYMEFLMTWLSMLKESGYCNPALFALDYTLVPEAAFPCQLHEAQVGYEYVLSKQRDVSKICFSGDSAGATLILSLLLSIPTTPHIQGKLPAIAVIISPWSIMLSSSIHDTRSDFLSAETLLHYGKLYVRSHVEDELVSPGHGSIGHWERASPTKGWCLLYGAEEVLASEARSLRDNFRKAGANVHVHEEPNWIHAWPVVKFFLGNSSQERYGGLREMTAFVQSNIKRIE